ncbi:hypothetical protein TanjilG_32653 [Lupinus angustifolius]|uniref:pectinesterase n=1 Tax=Lupinus angustifolius TaxID=3871 RepID=A0A1J7HRK6_LUPAN|nr:PREDICTED: pectinesterase 3 [Lupinus angustifolius]OIW15414.1 hypothetical protein TanjilG_32653 [Lupinus angustifolius]
MDSLKICQGYGKVEDNHNLEDQQQSHHQPPHPKFSKPIIITISVFTILFLTFTISLTLAALIYHTNTESPDQPSNSATTIKSVCNVTRYPKSCFSSIISSSSFSQNPTTDPQAILKISLHVAFEELSALASSLVPMGNGHGPAVADCKEQIDDALSRLNDSVSLMSSGGDVLTDGEIGDIQTWVSAAVTDQQTCLDGLEEMGSVDAGEVKEKMLRSSEYLSNSLAIVAHLQVLLKQSHVPLH